MFQGTRFQCIDKVYTLERQNSESGLAVIATTPTDPDYSKLAFARSDNQRLLLGDPFLRDAILQSAALLIPQDTSLPISIRRWDIYPQPYSMPKESSIYVQTLLEGLEENEVHTSVNSFDHTGALNESLKGYRLRKLQHHKEYPNVSDLVCPDDRDTRELRACLTHLAHRFKVKVPEVRVSYLANLHALPKNQRRKIELPLIEKVVQQWTRESDVNNSKFTVEWQQSGKPVVRLSDEPVEISLTHDNRYCIAVAGSWSLGSDIVPVKHRNRKQWLGLLGQIADTLIDDNLDENELNRLGAAIWAVKEVLHKVNVKKTISMKIEQKINNGILFLCETDQGKLKVLACWKIFTRGRDRVVAISVIESETKIIADDALTFDYGGYNSLLNQQHYEIVGDGPQGQVVFVHRFPVTFMPVGQLSRHIYFTHYFFWAGMVREASAWPVLKRIAEQFATGKWGGVTNFAALKVLGEATTHDLIEVRMWASGNGGPQNSVLDLTYDFRKVLPDGGYERLALLEQQTTWVRIINHGIAKVDAYPDYYASFLDEMMPKFKGPNLPHPLPEPLKDLYEHENEDYLYTAPTEPSVKPVLHSQLIETSLEDANIVGNIYFANYYAWQGRVRDRFFHNIIPEYFLGTGEVGELICLTCRVDHLREAMPFDHIQVRMALKALKTCHATLFFEYYKLNSHGDKLKLATGKQDVVWVCRDSKKKPLARPFPKAVHEIFRKSIEQ
ncbi:MAG: polyketide synthase dehydratase domain-containing protein [Deltaproteobacteria bacterium]|nr:MAG: polyketide synthase dehydratase domain-containing protein [Deltaproteobacteria bacterium]